MQGNCFVVIWNGRPFAYLKTETAAWNLISLMRSSGNMGDASADVQLVYLEGAF